MPVPTGEGSLQDPALYFRRFGKPYRLRPKLRCFRQFRGFRRREFSNETSEPVSYPKVRFRKPLKVSSGKIKPSFFLVDQRRAFISSVVCFSSDETDFAEKSVLLTSFMKIRFFRHILSFNSFA